MQCRNDLVSLQPGFVALVEQVEYEHILGQHFDQSSVFSCQSMCVGELLVHIVQRHKVAVHVHEIHLRDAD